VWTIFIFCCSLSIFTDICKWPENQILIPDWTYFHCPDTTLVVAKNFHPLQDHFYIMLQTTALANQNEGTLFNGDFTCGQKIKYGFLIGPISIVLAPP